MNILFFVFESECWQVSFECVLNILIELDFIQEERKVFLWQVLQFYFLVVNFFSSIGLK